MLIRTMSVSVLGVVQSESWCTCVVLTRNSQLQIGRSWSRWREWTSFIRSVLTGVMYGVLLPVQPLIPGAVREENTLPLEAAQLPPEHSLSV